MRWLTSRQIASNALRLATSQRTFALPLSEPRRSNDGARPSADPHRRVKLRDGQRREHGRAGPPERAEHALLAGLVEVQQVLQIAGCEVAHPLIEIVHADLVEQLQADAAGV